MLALRLCARNSRAVTAVAVLLPLLLRLLPPLSLLPPRACATLVAALDVDSAARTMAAFAASMTEAAGLLLAALFDS